MQETGEKRKRRRLSILPGNMHHTFVEHVVEAHSPPFLSLSGTAFDTAGDAAVDGGEVGSSSPMVARSLLACVSVVWRRIFIGGNLPECVGAGGVLARRGSASARRGAGVLTRTTQRTSRTHAPSTVAARREHRSGTQSHVLA